MGDECTWDGSIYYITGPMFSGKTSALMRLARRRLVAKETILVLKWHKDTRYSTKCAATHDRILMEATPASRLSDHWEAALKVQNVFVDEAQFFPDARDFCEGLANHGKTVVISCLDTTFNRTPWPGVAELKSIAEDGVELSAVCMVCHQDAHFSKRISEETALIVEGGADKYMAVCRTCWHK